MNKGLDAWHMKRHVTMHGKRSKVDKTKITFKYVGERRGTNNGFNSHADSFYLTIWSYSDARSHYMILIT